MKNIKKKSFLERIKNKFLDYFNLRKPKKKFERDTEEMDMAQPDFIPKNNINSW